MRARWAFLACAAGMVSGGFLGYSIAGGGPANAIGLGPDLDAVERIEAGMTGVGLDLSRISEDLARITSGYEAVAASHGGMLSDFEVGMGQWHRVEAESEAADGAYLIERVEATLDGILRMLEDINDTVSAKLVVYPGPEYKDLQEVGPGVKHAAVRGLWNLSRSSPQSACDQVLHRSYREVLGSLGRPTSMTTDNVWTYDIKGGGAMPGIRVMLGFVNGYSASLSCQDY